MRAWLLCVIETRSRAPSPVRAHRTSAALEPRFFARVCALLGRPELAEEQYGRLQEALARELTTAFATKTLEEWLALFDDEDVCVGPVATRAEAGEEFGSPLREHVDVPLGQHTAAWRAEVGFTPRE